MDESIYRESLAEDRDNFIDNLFNKTVDVALDDVDDVLENPGLVINLDEVNNSALSRSTDIIEHLSGYYFDERYVREHPYIKNKITQEIDNIRRLLKMLAINEKAQDSLIQSITCNFGKSALYSALTALQQSTLNIQKQLNESVESIENIFQKMQEECKETFDSKEKESLEDGSITVKGTREFLKQLTDRLNGNTKNTKEGTVNTETGELLDEDDVTPISKIIG